MRPVASDRADSRAIAFTAQPTDPFRRACYTLNPEPPRACQQSCGGSPCGMPIVERQTLMKIAVPRETAEGETRVAITPPIAGQLIGEGV